ncbi:MAG: hypothetical protein JAZ03_12335 [Candidatus Thiodiazotropha taylori]|nr:hypothetical protein [Candidatus Thiodiazotropha taylori]MCW4334715.1 hypothetical protein [Candidatus Thiodiazotropha endolucinida]
MQSDVFEYEHVNEDRLGRTVRLVPTLPMKSCSYGELLNSMVDHGVEPDEISGIFKVSALDNSYSVLFKFKDSVDSFISLKQIKAGPCTFDVMKMTEQIVNIRVHWLPLYYDNSIVREVLQQFGEIMDIKMSTTSHEKLVAFNGVREVRVKTSEMRKQQIPHLVRFNSGQAMLLTIAGRPPYCLKCRQVGHVRQRCPNGRFSTVVERNSEQVPMADRTADPGPVSGPAPEVPVATASASSDPDAVVISPDGSTDAAGAGPSDPGLGPQEPMNEQTDTSLKRGWGSDDEGGSWITPNKTARPRSPSPDPLTLNPGFTPIYKAS